MCPKTLSENGIELQFATNHLGHFLFTLLLLPKILKSAPARIVNVTSLAHKCEYNWANSFFKNILNGPKHGFTLRE